MLQLKRKILLFIQELKCDEDPFVRMCGENILKKLDNLKNLKDDRYNNIFQREVDEFFDIFKLEIFKIFRKVW